MKTRSSTNFTIAERQRTDMREVNADKNSAQPEVLPAFTFQITHLEGRKNKEMIYKGFCSSTKAEYYLLVKDPCKADIELRSNHEFELINCDVCAVKIDKKKTSSTGTESVTFTAGKTGRIVYTAGYINRFFHESELQILHEGNND